MNIVINTKYSIGDAIYCAEICREYWANNRPYQVVGINIHINDHTMKIVYNIEQDRLVTSISETFLFSTYEECLKWCEEKNKSL